MPSFNSNFPRLASTQKSPLESLKAAPEGTAFSVYFDLFIGVEEPSEGLQSAC
jgi:hypothetical protein